MRLDKFLVDCAVGSRSQVKAILKKKEVQVNGQIESSPKRQIDEKKDRVTLAGQLLKHETFVYYLLNKPQGVVSATEDSQHQTVLDLLDELAHQKQVFPVGRLDIDTTGLLLLTNNGPLAHAMLSPKKHVAKVYQAKVEGLMTDEDVVAFGQGIRLKDFVCRPAQLQILESDQAQGSCLVQIEIAEGKFHQVKRMVASRGKKVLELKRISMGPLHLPHDLSEGHYRRLSAQELADLSGFHVDL
ncbi:pseudouridine synthase [Streptococcus downei]|uniref:Pseudouridine synthase n=1 Tax=Streptococcus downei MFe28 TaxID=764290 RepID=A0A380JDT8_STRDO|nr:pseudouridine synthase [Streptococcus downei]SUN36023.1 putative ribosomal small subunit pseudouridine synthase A [Streptococcus downei MFe28]